MASLNNPVHYYPNDVFFDIETLLNVAQPSSILLIGDQTSAFLDDYLMQKRLLNQNCEVTHIRVSQLSSLADTNRHDVGIAINLFEHIDKQTGIQVLSRLRDLLCHQYCVCLPIKINEKNPSETDWQLTEMFGFALERVALYDSPEPNNGLERDNSPERDDSLEQGNDNKLGLFKYNINDYKKTPEWLNSDNWANPEMWGKYWW